VRIALLSDIHGNTTALDACLADLDAQGGVDRIIAAGDLCMDGPRPRGVIRRLRQRNALVVRGNTDRMIADGDAEGDVEDDAAIRWQRAELGPILCAWLEILPRSVTIGDGPDGLYVTHATQHHDDEHVWPDAPDAQLERISAGIVQRTLAFGHLHVPYVRQWRDRLFVNVASSGLPKDGDPRAHYALLTKRAGGWSVRSRRVAYDVDRVERQLRKSDMPDVEKRIATLRRHRYKQLDDHTI
jgi:putative phosphoesterase